MAQRVVKVELILAAQGFMQGTDAAAKKVRELGSETEKLAQKREAFNTLGTAAVGFGSAVALGIGMAVAKFADFDQQMSYVQAATHESAANMNLLRDAALDAGARTVFSATEAAGAIEELSKAGVSTADILSGGLDAALDLAAAGGMRVADAAAVAATTLKQFGLEGRDASHIADLLAAGAGKAQGDVSDMAQALKQGGLVANQFGLSVDETVGTLSAFASAGMLGSDAGTSFRTMLLRLANPTGEAAEMMQELGINAYDAQGQFVGMQSLAGQLQTSLSGLTQEQQNAALAIIFGQDAIRGANVLLQEGADGIRKWTTEVDAQGYAAETAAMRLDNLKGDWEAFTGALDTAMISMGEGANGPLREFVQGLTGMVDRFNDLPDWAQQSAIGVGAVTAAVALGAGGFMLAVPKVAAYNAAIATMGTGAQRASRFVTGLGKAVGITAGYFLLAKGAEAAARGLGQLGDGAKSANETVSLLLNKDYDGLFEGMTKGAGGVNDLTDAMDKLLAGDFDNAFNRWGSDTFAFTGFTSSVGEAREQFALMGEALADMVSRGDGERAKSIFADLQAQFEAQGYTVDQLNEVMPQYKDALTGAANEAKMAGDATGAASGDLSEMESAASDAATALDSVVRALMEVAGGAMSVSEANDNALSSINAMTDAASAEGASLAGTNDASIALRDSIREVETAHRDSAVAILENGGTLDEATGKWNAGRDAVIRMLEAKGMDRAEAVKWADQNLGSASQVQAAMGEVTRAVNSIPKTPVIDLTARTSQAYNALMGVQSLLRRITGNHSIHVSTGQGGQGGLTFATGGLVNSKGMKVKSFASGGFEPGIYQAVPGGIHRFAEAGYDEGYVTTDPKYLPQSIDTMNALAGRLGLGQLGRMPAAAPVVNVAAPSLAGMSITGRLEVGGDGLARIIDGRIERAFEPSSDEAVRSEFGR
ncbi:phage tail tape measure protein [Microbacterium esteraromaticum]|nr:phage tail tape measure protein [Microbacterium esteraromaticum]